MTGVRRPAVAGLFYPADPEQLAADVHRHLDEAAPHEPAAAPTLRALVVPHAGYLYSGPTAGVGYRLLAPLAGRVRRVVLLGPPHVVPVPGVEVTSADAWLTPLGAVRVDDDARRRLQQGVGSGARRPDPGVVTSDRAHGPEHSLEVQLPFLQTTMPDVAVLPVLVGDASPASVADLLEPWWAEDTLLVVSTDLSHYLPAASATRRDRRTSAAVVAADPARIDDGDACGAQPLRALLHLAARHGATVRELDLRTSADTAGTPDRVVGYGAFAVEA